MPKVKHSGRLILMRDQITKSIPSRVGYPCQFRLRESLLLDLILASNAGNDLVLKPGPIGVFLG